MLIQQVARQTEEEEKVTPAAQPLLSAKQKASAAGIKKKREY